MHRLENDIYVLTIEKGIIKEFYDKRDTVKVNLAGKMNLFGSAAFTLVSDDVTLQKDKPALTPYSDRTSTGEIASVTDSCITLNDNKYDINTCYSLDNGITIEVQTNNTEISQFGINLELNFLGKTGTPYRHQFMPTSPYTSADNKYMYCIMTRADGRFLVCTALTECDGWKIDYSPEYAGHYIRNFKFLASFDKIYNGSNRKKIKVNMQCADSLEECYKIIHSAYNAPYCRIIVGGNFETSPVAEVSADTDEVHIISPQGHVTEIDTTRKKTFSVPVSDYGFYNIIPFCGKNSGMDALVWYGGDMSKLFDLSTSTIRKPYHGDVNLCEGGCFLWAMLADMRLNGHLKYDALAKSELNEIMGKNGANIPRKTILPYKTESYAAYHISGSKRIQEQFFGVSILIEAYRLYKNGEYLEFAVSALNELIENWITEDGMITNGEDYTTVCAPVIPIVDMANLLSELGDSRSKLFYDTSVKIAEYLIKRGFNFPTEGTGEDSESDAEDGSISCTALSVLYVCANLHYDKRYIDFAREILQLHKAWTIYSPDVRMNRSSFRWWETIWEGDGEGPAICAGHAWTIWKAEALYLYSMLTYDEGALLDSWNGFMTNLSKTTKDGIMYACYEADYIRGGGDECTKLSLLQLTGEDVSTKYVIAHDYPKHCDNSLSRYAWARNAYSWYNTAAILQNNEVIYGLNMEVSENVFACNDNITNIFIGKIRGDITIKTQRSIRIYTSNSFQVLQGEITKDYISPVENIIKLHLI